MKLKDSELKNILAEVEAEIGALLKSEGDALLKAAPPPGEETEAPAPADEGSSAPAGDEGSDPSAGGPPPEASAPGPDAGSAPPGAEGSAPPGAEGSAPPGEPPMDPAMDPAAQGPVDPAMLQAEYSKLPPEELKSHYMAAKAALFALMGAGDGAAPAGPEASAPPMAPPEASAPPMAPPGVPPPAMKAEIPSTMTKNPANGALKDQAATVPDAIKGLSKSETDGKISDLEQQVELMAKALDLALGTPVRKAVTSVAFVPRTTEAAESAEPTKADIDNKITNALRSGKLNKSEKDRIVSYSLGNIKFEQIKELLK